MGSGFLDKLAALGLEVSARPEARDGLILVHIERIRLGPVPLPVPVVLRWLRGKLAGQGGVEVDPGRRVIVADTRAWLPAAVTVTALRAEGGRVTLRLGPDTSRSKAGRV